MNHDDLPPLLHHIADNADLGNELDKEIAGMADPNVIRNNCAFCGRERTRADDNHDKGCAYWDFFGGAA